MTADRLMRFYPRAWRERYGAEFVETVGPQRLHPQQIMDIAMGAVDAWLSADVRRSATGAVAGATQGGGLMVSISKVACARSNVRMTTRDAMISAGVLIVTSFVLITIGVMLRRSGRLDTGEAIVSLSFPVSILASMPFGMMKGQPWRAQALVLGVTFALLIAAGYLSILI